MSSYPMAHKCAPVVMVSPPRSVACRRSRMCRISSPRSCPLASRLGWIESVVQLSLVVCSDQFAAWCFAREQDRLAVEADLDGVWPKQQREGPVGHDAQPPAPARHLKQVVGAAY